MNIIDEIWKDVPEFEGFYQVSNFGRVRSCDRYIRYKDGRLRFFRGRVLQLKLAGAGYHQVGLSVNLNVKYCLVHSLVLLAFVGAREKDKEVNHIDGNKLNNTLLNLEYCTKSENHKHAYALGLRHFEGMPGESNPRARLKNSDIPVIRQRIKNGEPNKIIAKDYGVHKNIISDIKCGKKWRSIN